MDTMTTALQKAIQRDGRSLNAIGIAAGVDRAMLCRFMNGERSLTLDTADRVCAGLAVSVQLAPVRKRKAVKR